MEKVWLLNHSLHGGLHVVVNKLMSDMSVEDCTKVLCAGVHVVIHVMSPSHGGGEQVSIVHFTCMNRRGLSQRSFRPAARREIHQVSLCRFERRHIDGEAVLHIRLDQSVVGFVHFLDGDDLDIGSDIMGPAKIEHLLGFGDAANWRTGEASTSEYKAEGSDGERLFRRADEGDVAIAA